MATGTIHTVADDLHLIEGHHPHNIWDDPDLPASLAPRSSEVDGTTGRVSAHQF